MPYDKVMPNTVISVQNEVKICTSGDSTGRSNMYAKKQPLKCAKVTALSSVRILGRSVV